MQTAGYVLGTEGHWAFPPCQFLGFIRYSSHSSHHIPWLTGNDQHFLIQVCKWHAVSWGDWNAERGWGGGRLTSCRDTFSLGESNWLSGEQTHDFNFISTSLQLIKLTIQSAPRTNTRKPRAKWIWRGRPSVYILNKPLTTFHALLREPSEPLAGHLTHSL